jgi:hypothetical protein
MNYEKYDRAGQDEIVSHYIYLEDEWLLDDADETAELDFLEKNGVDISAVDRIGYEPENDRVIYHEVR